jgi:hypothetical protein
MKNYTIQKNTPLWGVVQLLTEINNNFSNFDFEIAENPNSGFIYAYSEDLPYMLVADRQNAKPYKWFFLNYSGIEFAEYEAVNIDFKDLHEDDILQLIDILEELRENERAEEVRNYKLDIDFDSPEAAH